MSVYFYFYQNEMLYIGSTFNLKQRKKDHKSALKCGNTRPFYKYLREHNLNFDNLRIEVVETAIYEKEPLHILEDMMIDYWKPKYNLNRAYLSEAEKKEYMKEYYEDNKEKVLANNKQYYEDNKEKVLEKQKQYQQNNKEEINRKDRERYAKKKLEKLSTI